MFTLKVDNGQSITELTHDLKNYAVISVQGLTPPATTINTSIAGSIDGSFFNSARAETRNIVITIVLRGDIEGNRQRLYYLFPRKKEITLYYKNKNRDVKISGWVETLEGDLFVQKEQMQISIICPRPYFQAVTSNTNYIQDVQALFQWPFSISADDPVEISAQTASSMYTYNNAGDVETGAVYTFTFEGAVTGLTLTNNTTGEYIGFNYSFTASDVLTVSTIQGALSAKLIRNGAEINLLNYLSSGSTWVKFAVGDNALTYSVTTGNDSDVICSFTAPTLFGGV